VGPRAVLDKLVKIKIPSLRREPNPRIPIVQPEVMTYHMHSSKEHVWKVGVHLTGAGLHFPLLFRFEKTC
jgi:hypothetical protein